MSNEYSRRRLRSTGMMMIVIGIAAAPVQGQTTAMRPLTLEESLALTLEGNRGVRRARLSVQTAERQVVEARGNAFPEVTATAGYTRNLTPLKSFLPALFLDPTADPDDFIAIRFGADNLWNTTLSIHQPIFDYRVIVGLRVAGQARQLQVENLRGEAQGAATQARKTFYGALLARERYRLLQSSRQRVGELLEETRARREAGQAGDYDVLRLEVELGNLEPPVRQAYDALEAAWRDLAVLMGLPPETRLELLGSLGEIDLTAGTASTEPSRQLLELAGLPGATPEDFEQVWATAALDRADFRQTTIDLRLGRGRVELAASEFYPTLSTFYTYSLNAQQSGRAAFFGDDPGQRVTSRQAGLQLTVPLFRGWQRLARVQQQRLALERAHSSREELQSRSAAQIRSLLAALEETRLRALAQQRSVELARRGYTIAAATYREGLGSRLEVVDAENALRQAQFNYVQAVYDHLVAQADLDWSAGKVPLVDEIAGR